MDEDVEAVREYVSLHCQRFMTEFEARCYYVGGRMAKAAGSPLEEVRERALQGWERYRDARHCGWQTTTVDYLFVLSSGNQTDALRPILYRARHDKKSTPTTVSRRTRIVKPLAVGRLGC